jgi:predicted PilT family ATPase
MKIKNVEIRMCPDPTKTRIFINDDEVENVRSFEIKVEDGQNHPTGIKIEFENCNIKMVPLWE